MLKWLKAIYMLPFMIFMGGVLTETVETEEVEEQVESEDLETPEEPAGDESIKLNEKPEETEKPQDTESEEPPKETLEEIVARKAAEAVRAERERVEREVEARRKEEEKPFVELTAEQVERLNSQYLTACDKREEYRELFRLAENPEDKQQYLVELRKVERWITETEAWYADNEGKKQEWEAKRQIKTTQHADFAEKARRLEEVSEIFRESKSIPQDVWDTSAKWFAEHIKTDKVTGAKFADVYRLHGDVAAVEFAFNYSNEHMGKKQASALAEKEDGKNKLLTTPTGQNRVQESDLKELRELHAKAARTGREEDYAAFVAAKRKAGVTGSIHGR